MTTKKIQSTLKKTITHFFLKRAAITELTEPSQKKGMTTSEHPAPSAFTPVEQAPKRVKTETAKADRPLIERIQVWVANYKQACQDNKIPSPTGKHLTITADTKLEDIESHCILLGDSERTADEILGKVIDLCNEQNTPVFCLDTKHYATFQQNLFKTYLDDETGCPTRGYGPMGHCLWGEGERVLLMDLDKIPGNWLSGELGQILVDKNPILGENPVNADGLKIIGFSRKRNNPQSMDAAKLRRFPSGLVTTTIEAPKKAPEQPEAGAMEVDDTPPLVNRVFDLTHKQDELDLFGGMHVGQASNYEMHSGFVTDRTPKTFMVTGVTSPFMETMLAKGWVPGHQGRYVKTPHRFIQNIRITEDEKSALSSKKVLLTEDLRQIPIVTGADAYLVNSYNVKTLFDHLVLDKATQQYVPQKGLLQATFLKDHTLVLDDSLSDQQKIKLLTHPDIKNLAILPSTSLPKEVRDSISLTRSRLIMPPTPPSFTAPLPEIITCANIDEQLQELNATHSEKTLISIDVSQLQVDPLLKHIEFKVNTTKNGQISYNASQTEMPFSELLKDPNNVVVLLGLEKNNSFSQALSPLFNQLTTNIPLGDGSNIEVNAKLISLKEDPNLNTTTIDDDYIKVLKSKIHDLNEEEEAFLDLLVDLYRAPELDLPHGIFEPSVYAFNRALKSYHKVGKIMECFPEGNQSLETIQYLTISTTLGEKEDAGEIAKYVLKKLPRTKWYRWDQKLVRKVNLMDIEPDQRTSDEDRTLSKTDIANEALKLKCGELTTEENQLLDHFITLYNKLGEFGLSTRPCTPSLRKFKVVLSVFKKLRKENAPNNAMFETLQLTVLNYFAHNPKNQEKALTYLRSKLEIKDPIKWTAYRVKSLFDKILYLGPPGSEKSRTAKALYPNHSRHTLNVYSEHKDFHGEHQVIETVDEAGTSQKSNEFYPGSYTHLSPSQAIILDEAGNSGKPDRIDELGIFPGRANTTITGEGTLLSTQHEAKAFILTSNDPFESTFPDIFDDIQAVIPFFQADKEKATKAINAQLGQYLPDTNKAENIRTLTPMLERLREGVLRCKSLSDRWLSDVIIRVSQMIEDDLMTTHKLTLENLVYFAAKDILSPIPTIQPLFQAICIFCLGDQKQVDDSETIFQTQPDKTHTYELVESAEIFHELRQNGHYITPSTIAFVHRFLRELAVRDFRVKHKFQDYAGRFCVRIVGDAGNGKTTTIGTILSVLNKRHPGMFKHERHDTQQRPQAMKEAVRRGIKTGGIVVIEEGLTVDPKQYAEFNEELTGGNGVNPGWLLLFVDNPSDIYNRGTHLPSVIDRYNSIHLDVTSEDLSHVCDTLELDTDMTHILARLHGSINESVLMSGGKGLAVLPQFIHLCKKIKEEAITFDDIQRVALNPERSTLFFKLLNETYDTQLSLIDAKSKQDKSRSDWLFELLSEPTDKDKVPTYIKQRASTASNQTDISKLLLLQLQSKIDIDPNKKLLVAYDNDCQTIHDVRLTFGPADYCLTLPTGFKDLTEKEILGGIGANNISIKQITAIIIASLKWKSTCIAVSKLADFRQAGVMLELLQLDDTLFSNEEKTLYVKTAPTPKTLWESLVQRMALQWQHPEAYNSALSSLLTNINKTFPLDHEKWGTHTRLMCHVQACTSISEDNKDEQVKNLITIYKAFKEDYPHMATVPTQETNPYYRTLQSFFHTSTSTMDLDNEEPKAVYDLEKTHPAFDKPLSSRPDYNLHCDLSQNLRIKVKETFEHKYLYNQALPISTYKAHLEDFDENAPITENDPITDEEFDEFLEYEGLDNSPDKEIPFLTLYNAAKKLQDPEGHQLCPDEADIRVRIAKFATSFIAEQQVPDGAYEAFLQNLVNSHQLKQHNLCASWIKKEAEASDDEDISGDEDTDTEAGPASASASSPAPAPAPEETSTEQQRSQEILLNLLNDYLLDKMAHESPLLDSASSESSSTMRTIKKISEASFNTDPSTQPCFVITGNIDEGVPLRFSWKAPHLAVDADADDDSNKAFSLPIIQTPNKVKLKIQVASDTDISLSGTLRIDENTPITYDVDSSSIEATAEKYKLLPPPPSYVQKAKSLIHNVDQEALLRHLSQVKVLSENHESVTTYLNYIEQLKEQDVPPLAKAILLTQHLRTSLIYDPKATSVSSLKKGKSDLNLASHLLHQGLCLLKIPHFLLETDPFNNGVSNGETMITIKAFSDDETEWVDLEPRPNNGQAPSEKDMQFQQEIAHAEDQIRLAEIRSKEPILDLPVRHYTEEERELYKYGGHLGARYFSDFARETENLPASIRQLFLSTSKNSYDDNAVGINNLSFPHYARLLSPSFKQQTYEHMLALAAKKTSTTPSLQASNSGTLTEVTTLMTTPESAFHTWVSEESAPPVETFVFVAQQKSVEQLFFDVRPPKNCKVYCVVDESKILELHNVFTEVSISNLRHAMSGMKEDNANLSLLTEDLEDDNIVHINLLLQKEGIASDHVMLPSEVRKFEQGFILRQHADILFVTQNFLHKLSPESIPKPSETAVPRIIEDILSIPNRSLSDVAETFRKANPSISWADITRALSLDNPDSPIPEKPYSDYTFSQTCTGLSTLSHKINSTLEKDGLTYKPMNISEIRKQNKLNEALPQTKHALAISTWLKLNAPHVALNIQCLFKSEAGKQTLTQWLDTAEDNPVIRGFKEMFDFYDKHPYAYIDLNQFAMNLAKTDAYLESYPDALCTLSEVQTSYMGRYNARANFRYIFGIDQQRVEE